MLNDNRRGDGVGLKVSSTKRIFLEFCQDLTSITQSELMRQVNDNSKNGECTLYRPATYTMIHVVSSLCT